VQTFSDVYFEGDEKPKSCNGLFSHSLLAVDRQPSEYPTLGSLSKILRSFSSVFTEPALSPVNLNQTLYLLVT